MEQVQAKEGSGKMEGERILADGHDDRRDDCCHKLDGVGTPNEGKEHQEAQASCAEWKED